MTPISRLFSVSPNRILFVLLLLPLLAAAQTWRNPLNNNTSPNFYEIQADFNRYWEGKTPEKGSGWKAFKRWEWFWAPRVNPDGSFPSADANEKALKEWYAANPGAQDRGGNTQWTSLGPNSSNGGYSGTGRINCMAVDPNNPNKLWVGTPAGGLWKSETGGYEWLPMTDQAPSLGVSAIAINPLNTQIMYIGTGDGDASDTRSTGVWRSSDGGNSWQPTALSWTTNQQRTIRALIINPVNPLRLICAANDGIYYTADGGQSWSKTAAIGQVSDLEFKPGNPEVVYACIEGEIYRSLKGGASTWQKVLEIPGAGRIALCVTPLKPNWVGALCTNSNSAFHSFWATDDEGKNWTKMSDSPNILGWEHDGDGGGGQGWYDLCAAASPTNPDEVYIGGVNVWRSFDGGGSWTAASHWYKIDQVPEVHADQHALVFTPDNTLYVCNDGGIYRSGNDGATFEVITGNLVNSQIYRISAAQQNETVLTGLQDNGTKLRRTSGDWSDVLGGDGMDCHIDPVNPNVIYGSIQNGRIHRSANSGANWKQISDGIEEKAGAWITPYILNPKNRNQLFAGYQNVWRSNNAGDTWEQVSINLPGSTLDFLAMSPNDTNRIYAATGTAIWRSDDGGIVWNPISTGLTSVFISRIAVHPENASEIYATFSGYQAGIKVFRSKNAGGTWENITDNLPNAPANCLLFHQNGKNGLYVGTDIGIFYRDSTTTNWVRYTDGLPNAPVVDLDIRTQTNELVAATYGRGAWTAPALDADNILCSLPTGLTVTDSAFAAAAFRWDSVPAWGFQLRVRPAGNSAWTVGSAVQSTRAVQFGLTPGTQYEAQVRALCQGKDGDWGPSVYFSTPKVEGEYCPSFGNTSKQWIDSLAIANVYNSSGNNLGYAYFTDTVRMTAGETYPIAVFSKSAGNPSVMFWRTWLDLNADNDFDDAGELLFQRTTTTPPSFSRNFVVPAGAKAGPTRFRISMGSSTNSSPCLTTQEVRDVEDYAVYIQESTVSAGSPEQTLSFDLQPNPADDAVFLQLPVLNRPLFWSMAGLDGRIYESFQPVADLEVEISVEHLPAGMYFIRLQDERGNNVERRFIKTR